MEDSTLTPAQLIYAYSNGYFPMAEDPQEGGEIFWHRPKMRGVIPLNDFHISKNLRRLWRNHNYTLRINGNFREVICACAERDQTWINDEIIEAYCALQTLGHAMSFEVWSGENLVGGLYGVNLGKAFFGESMFSRETNTSKLALVYLVSHLKDNQYTLLDTQYLNPHLMQFGAIEITDKKYMSLLAEALAN